MRETVDDDVRVQTYPPLGRVTIVKDGHVNFTAVLNQARRAEGQDWQVALWHQIDEGEWSELLLQRSRTSDEPHNLQSSSVDQQRQFYSNHLTFRSTVQFTLKYRLGDVEEWEWVGDGRKLSDGHVLMRSTTYMSDNLLDIIPDQNSTWATTSLMSQSPKTNLWSLETVIPAANGDTSSYGQVDIGTPWTSYLR